MNSISLLDVAGYALQWIREQAGWSRPRVTQILQRNREVSGDFMSTKSMERWEASPLVPPLVVNRYRQVIGPDVFDELLERSRRVFPHMQSQQHGGAVRKGKPVRARRLPHKRQQPATCTPRPRGRHNPQEGTKTGEAP